jgi:hypothetical protein
MRGAVVGLVVVVGVAACSGGGGEREVGIAAARVDGERTLAVNLNVCNAPHNEATVDETAEAVTITVVTDGPRGGDDCSDGITVALDAPLGDRAVIDGSTGGPVRLDPPYDGVNTGAAKAGSNAGA